jgi:hypothetical protein
MFYPDSEDPDTVSPPWSPGLLHGHPDTDTGLPPIRLVISDEHRSPAETDEPTTETAVVTPPAPVDPLLIPAVDRAIAVMGHKKPLNWSGEFQLRREPRKEEKACFRELYKESLTLLFRTHPYEELKPLLEEWKEWNDAIDEIRVYRGSGRRSLFLQKGGVLLTERRGQQDELEIILKAVDNNRSWCEATIKLTATVPFGKTPS